MVRIDDVISCLEEMAPEELAEPWDNCGLIIGSGREFTERVVACLDVTCEVVDEALEKHARLIVSHHPLLFTPVKRIGLNGRRDALLRALIKNDIALYCMHTNADKTYGGLNDLLAGIVGLEPELPVNYQEELGYYRAGSLPREYALTEFCERVCQRLKLRNVCVSAASGPDAGGRIKNVVVMCGAYDLSPDKVFRLNADAVLCGEIKYHELLELTGMGVHVVQAGHHGTERFFCNLIEKWVKDKYPALQVDISGFYADPTEVYHSVNAGGGI